MKIIKWWNEFWFAPIDLFPIALARTFFGLTLLFGYLFRFGNLDLLTTGAYVSRDRAIELIPETMRPPFLWTFWTDDWAFLMHLLFCLLLFLWSFGVGGRILGWLTWIIHMGFIQRNFSMIFGADIIASVFLFYFVFIETPVEMKNFGWLRFRIKRNPFKSDFVSVVKSDLVSVVFFRLVQIQMAVLYSFTGFEKLRGASWWDGTALWSVFANPQMVIFDMSFLKSVPWIIVVLSYTTVIFEVYFAPAILSQKWKKYWLMMGVGFHLGIALFLNLWTFSFLVLSIYFIYLDPAHLRNWCSKMIHNSPS